MVQPKFTLVSRIKFFIAGLAWRIYLWASDQTEAELLGELYENAINEYKSEKANNWMSN